MPGDPTLSNTGWTLVALAGATLLAGPGCLEPYCAGDADCRALERCNLQTHQCERADPGPAWPLDPPCEPACDNPTPVCDPDTTECRECASDPECLDQDPATPACQAGACVQCTDSASHCGGGAPICDTDTWRCEPCDSDPQCVALDAATPACVAGACQPCGDSASHCGSAAAAVCDPDSHRCRPCRDHAECDHLGGVCDQGTCLRPEGVTYVDAAASCPGDGSPLSPYCGIVEALAPGDATAVLRVEPGSYDPFTLHDNTVWIIGRASGVYIDASQAPNETNAVTVVHLSGSDLAQVTLERVTLTGARGVSTAAGLVCDALSGTPTLTLRDVEVTDNDTGGIQMTDCDVTVRGGRIHTNRGVGISATDSALAMDRVWVEHNGGGGLALDSSRFTLENCAVVANGGINAPVGGVSLSSPVAPAVLRHVTVVANQQQSLLSFADGVGCAGGDCSVVQLESSIVAGHGADGDLDPGITPRYCLIEDASGASGGPGNLSGDPGFVAPDDIHLAPGSPCEGAGDPSSPTGHDIDGEDRPRPAGTRPDCGADEVSP